ncbi:MAG: response regulator [Oscillospiraceae bacterium]|jgi:CheY-like chemotaxis protein|nr:response regulator [Oscillospiraceae bacterium]
MKLLMVEDELKDRLDFKEYIATLNTTLGYQVDFYIAQGESDGISLVQKFDFDAIILDLELHSSDGDGFAFLKKLQQLNLTEKPYILVSTNNRSMIVKENARKMGADYVFWKFKLDYSPKLVMEHLCIYFEHRINSDKISGPTLVVEKLSLEDDVKLQVSKIGINDDMIGKKYVIESIVIVAKSNDSDINLHKDVFPLIAKKYNKSIGSVNRAIESAINKAWCITDDSILSELYPAVVSGSKGAPTNKEFIFYYANKIKDEYKG